MNVPLIDIFLAFLSEKGIKQIIAYADYFSGDWPIVYSSKHCIFSVVFSMFASKPFEEI